MVRRKLKFLEKSQKRCCIHIQQFTDALATYLNIRNLFFQPCATAGTANSPAAVTAEHITELYLVLLGLNPGEEIVYAGEILVPVPEKILLFLCELGIRTVNGEIKLVGIFYQAFFVPAHQFSSPGSHGILIYAQRRVGDHEFLVYAHHAAETSANGTSPQRVIEGEHGFRWLLKHHPVRLKYVGEQPVRVNLHAF